MCYIYNLFVDCSDTAGFIEVSIVVIKRVFYLPFDRRRVFNLQQHFVHLNLSIALLLGLITFVSGIETASEYRVRVCV